MKKKLLLAWLLFICSSIFWIAWDGGIHSADLQTGTFSVALALLICMLVTAISFDIFSIATILTCVFYTVALVPAGALLLGSPLYSFHNIKHQLNTETALYTMNLYFWASFTCTLVLLILKTLSGEYKTTGFKSPKLYFPFYFSCLLFVVFTYLAEPGLGLLSGKYSELLEERNETTFATLAGIMMSVFWVISYIHFRTYSFEKRQKMRRIVFILATTFTMVWLYLHARRSEMVGIVIVLFVHQKFITGRIRVIHIAAAFSVVLAMYVLGHIRNSDNLVAGLQSEGIENAFSTKYTGTSKGDIANMPAGIGNIAETMQTTVYHFKTKSSPLLLGETIFNYPSKLLPSVIRSSIGMGKPTYFGELILGQYSYNGGTFILAPAYGNFGFPGFIIGAVAMGLLIFLAEKGFYKNNQVVVVLSCAIILYFIRTVWYKPIPMIKTAYFGVFIILLVNVIFRQKK